MKKVYVKVALVGAMMASVMVTSCGSGKQVVQAPVPQQNTSPAKTDDVEAELKHLENEARLLEARQKMEDAKANAARASKQREIDDAVAEAKRVRDIEQANKEAAILEVQMLKTPCIEEVMKAQANGSIAALGIGEPNGNDAFNEEQAYADALVKARERMGDMFFGYLKNISTDYKARTSVPLGNLKEQSNFERGVRTGGERAINKFTSYPCTKMTKTDRNTYKCYVAGTVPIDKLQESIAKELDVLKVKYDQKVLFDQLDKDIADMNKKEQEGLKQMLENVTPASE
jgi:hypothetical protein